MFTRTRLKFLIARSDSGAWGEDAADDGVTVLRSTDIDLLGRVDGANAAIRSLSRREIAATSLAVGDIVVVKSSGSDAHLGKAGLINEQHSAASFSNFLQRLRLSRATDPRFIWYFLNCQDMKSQIRELSSTTTGLQNLTGTLVGEAAVPFPPLEEQRRIADFLDAETARIDQLATRQRTAASLLSEREQALLDGLVDQLSNDFQALPLRRFITRIEQGSSPQCDNVEARPGEWGVLKVSAVKRGLFDPRENKRLPDDQLPLKHYEIRSGDLLVTRANTPLLVGAAAVAHEPPPRLLLCDKIFRVNVTTALDKDFVALVARGSRIRALCAEGSHGTSQSMANLKADEVKDWPMPAAPLKIQYEVLRRLTANSAILIQLRDLIATQLQVLAERRQALITAAVTGQFDVATGRGVDLS